MAGRRIQFAPRAASQQVIGAVVRREIRRASPKILTALEPTTMANRLVLESCASISVKFVRHRQVDGRSEGLTRGQKVTRSLARRSWCRWGDECLGRIINVIGEPVDELGPVGATSRRDPSARRPPMPIKRPRRRSL